MIPVLNAQQVRDVDAHTIAQGHISSLELMERASSRCAAQIGDRLRAGYFGPRTAPVLILVGMGNNGGDGLVIARLLHATAVPVRVVRLVHRPEASPEHAANLRRLLDMGITVQDLDEPSISSFQVRDDEVVVDAILGTGTTAPLRGWLADVVATINASRRPVVAIDMPTGLMAEENADNDPRGIVQADLTLTFEVPKLAFLFAENAHYTGEVQVLPIGLDAAMVKAQPTPYRVLEGEDMHSLLPLRPRFGHKGTFGHVLLMAGASGKVGAAVLATRAALRSGAGLVTVHLPAKAASVMHVAAPEAMCSADEQDDRLSMSPRDLAYTALGIGPGIGTEEDTCQLVKRVVQEASTPLVMDADALNALAMNPTWIAFLPKGTILTPHPGEFDRLHREPVRSSYERLGRARDMARRNGVIVVLKGAYTAVCDPSGQVFFNPTGNPGMAKGGAGDVLTGLLAGLLAQRIPPLQAALLGVYLHGLAGDLAARHSGIDGMTASDLVDALPEAWQELRNASEESLQ